MPKTVEQLYRTIVKYFPEGPTTQGPISVTGEPYVEWALGVYTKSGFDSQALLCERFLDHIMTQAEKMGGAENLRVYFRIKPEYGENTIDNPDHPGHGRDAGRIYVRYLLTRKMPSDPPYPVYPKSPDLDFVEYLEAP